MTDQHPLLAALRQHWSSRLCPCISIMNRDWSRGADITFLYHSGYIGCVTLGAAASIPLLTYSYMDHRPSKYELLDPELVPKLEARMIHHALLLPEPDHAGS